MKMIIVKWGDGNYSAAVKIKKLFSFEYRYVDRNSPHNVFCLPDGAANWHKVDNYLSAVGLARQYRALLERERKEANLREAANTVISINGVEI